MDIKELKKTDWYEGLYRVGYKIGIVILVFASIFLFAIPWVYGWINIFRNLL